jgi:hypothetical protein
MNYECYEDERQQKSFMKRTTCTEDVMLDNKPGAYMPTLYTEFIFNRRRVLVRKIHENTCTVRTSPVRSTMMYSISRGKKVTVPFR